MSISDVDTEVKSSKSQKHKDGYSVLCYAMLRGFALYLAKRVHTSIEIRPYNFRLSWALISHQGYVYSHLI